MFDNVIRAELRKIFRRLRLDLTSLQYGSYGGVVRLRGTLRTTERGTPLGIEHLEALTRDLRGVHRVRRVDLHLTNARQTPDGAWHLRDDQEVEPIEAEVHTLDS